MMKLLEYILLLLFLIIPLNGCNQTRPEKSYIKPFPDNPSYWQYKGEPVLLLGGSNDDNLFQSDNIIEQLDLLHSIGGNYIRNTMSCRDSGNLQPFELTETGFYNLDKWDNEYWKRFENLLKLTNERDIIVQIEIWDRFDFSREEWLINAFNPANNINYSFEETGFDSIYRKHPSQDKQPFFHTIEGMPRYSDKLDIVLVYQEAFISKLLSHSLKYGNVLYCMNNETSTPPEWGNYWIEFIRNKAKETNVDVYLTDMYDKFFNLADCPECMKQISEDEFYDFLDISQVNSRTFGQTHWDSLMSVFSLVGKYKTRPLNNTKIYGGGNFDWGSGTNKDGVERFCRDIMAGSASARHHRPYAGCGLNDLAVGVIKAVRNVEEYIKFWEIKPNMSLLIDREDNEAYVSSDIDLSTILVYFTATGEVKLNLKESYSVQWIDIGTGNLIKEEKKVNPENYSFQSENPAGMFIVLLKNE